MHCANLEFFSCLVRGPVNNLNILPVSSSPDNHADMYWHVVILAFHNNYFGTGGKLPFWYCASAKIKVSLAIGSNLQPHVNLH